MPEKFNKGLQKLFVKSQTVIKSALWIRIQDLGQLSYSFTDFRDKSNQGRKKLDQLGLGGGYFG